MRKFLGRNSNMFFVFEACKVVKEIKILIGAPTWTFTNKEDEMSKIFINIFKVFI
jgi:hypothetical protein